MKEWISTSTEWFNKYYGSFNNLTESHKRIFETKKEHSFRVAEIALNLTEKLDWSEDERQVAYLVGLLHDIGRFSQMAEFDTFNDDKSEDHAEKAIAILKSESLLEDLNVLNKELIYTAIFNHNKFKIQDGLTGQELLHSKLIRDADKLDIFRVLTEFYSQKKGILSHSLTWELQKTTVVSPAVAKEVLAGKLVSKKNIVSEVDVKVMQLSWVFDFNFRPAIEHLLKYRYLESVYNSLPKNDIVIDIYRKIKVFAENKIMY